MVRPDVAAYVVQQNGREILRLPAWATSVTVGALAPGSTYSFSVYSIDASGDRTADSETIQVTTQVLSNGVTIGATSVVESPEQFVYSADYLVPVAFRRVFIETANPTSPCWSTGSTPQICADYRHRERAIAALHRNWLRLGLGTSWPMWFPRSPAPCTAGRSRPRTSVPPSLRSRSSMPMGMRRIRTAASTSCARRRGHHFPTNSR